MSGDLDTMIQPHHSTALYNSFKGEKKKLIIFEGSHNSTRPRKVLKDCYDFIQNNLGINVNMSGYMNAGKKQPIVTKEIKPLAPLKKVPMKKEN